MKRKNKFRRGLGYAGLVLLVLFAAGFVYLSVVSHIAPPAIADTSSLELRRSSPSPGLYTIGNSWFRKSNSGLYELYVEGRPFERGVINGKLTEELVQRQEDHFNDQITKMIPSNFYRHFLKYVIGWFNRNLAAHIPEEYKQEIFGISHAASPKYGYIGTNYERILNYHAAHDIGHALQSMALVGCTSFGTWGADSNMIIGRNFDFYVGDRFAEDKIVAFFNPSEGHKFMTVTWGGFIGAVSGMNDQGLTVTINAAKTDLPSGSATPVSLVAREMLQYAANLQEALAIARKRKMFVSESFLVGSAADNKAIIIEKTPTSLDVYDPNKQFIVCANHFQGSGLLNSAANQQQIKESASDYRYRRVMQLLDTTGHNTVSKAAALLRDRGGLNNADIGMGNEKAINQLIAHHTVIFEPRKMLVWVSTAPWQLGEFVAYDLRKVFALRGLSENREVSDSALDIPADHFLQEPGYRNFLVYRYYRQRETDDLPINVDSLVASNPSYNHTYVLAGDYYFRQKQYAEALPMYQQALTREIATKQERDYITGRIETCRKKIHA